MPSGRINPSIFPKDKQALASKARDADDAHLVRIKGTASKKEIQNSFREAKKEWKPDIRDRVSLGGHRTAPDGGMRQFARSRGYR